MVELEQKPPQFLTFRFGDAQVIIPAQNTYRLNEVMKITSALGIKPQDSIIYKAIDKLSPNSKLPANPSGLRMPDNLTLDHLQIVVGYFIEIGEAKKIRSFEIADGQVIELEGITDKQWALYEPLLNALRKTRIQTESGEVEITSMSYQGVKEYFPENTSWRDIQRHYKILSNALAPSGWSIDRKEQLPKNTGAPWFLRGPDDYVQNEGQPKPQQKITYDGNVGQEKKPVALKQFDPLAFGTRLLHSCVSILTNPDAEGDFTKDLREFMSSCLPADLKPDSITEDKTLQEYFREVITDAINSMAGKTYEELSEIQQTIMPMWNELRIKSEQHPKMAIFEHFGIQPNSKIPPNLTSSPAPESPKDTNHS